MLIFEFLIDHKLLQPFLNTHELCQISYIQKPFKDIVQELETISLTLHEDNTNNYSLYDQTYMNMVKCLNTCKTLKHVDIRFFGKHVGRYLLLYLISKLEKLESLTINFDYCYIDICKCFTENFKWIHLNKFVLKINLGISSTDIYGILKNITTNSTIIEHLNVDFIKETNLHILFNTTKLKTLILSFSYISYKGFQNICSIIQNNPHLEHLELQCVLSTEPINTFFSEIKLVSDYLRHVKYLKKIIIEIYSMRLITDNIIHLLKQLHLHCTQIEYVHVRGYRSDVLLRSKEEQIRFLSTLQTSFF